MDIYQMLRVPSGTSKEKLQEKYIKMLETYQLVVEFADDPTVVIIAKKKRTQLLEAGQQAHLITQTQGQNASKTTQEQLADIKMMLGSKSTTGKDLQEISQKIAALPESAEKHYLQAQLLVKKDVSLEGIRAIAEQLRFALEQDPNNAAYRGFYEVVNAQVRERQRQMEEAAFQQSEQERKTREAAEDARMKEFITNIASFACVGFLCCGCCQACPCCG